MLLEESQFVIKVLKLASSSSLQSTMSAKLPVEILRIVASHLNPYHLIELVTADRYFAWMFEGVYYDSWVVDCCKSARKPWRLRIDVRGHSYETGIHDFFDQLKNGTAPAFAKKVCFNFCVHEEEYDEKINEDWLLESTPIELLNCNEVVVSVEYIDYEYRILCNEPLIEHLLRKSLKELNAVLKFRLEKPYKSTAFDDGYYHVTVRDSEMIPIVLSEIQPGYMTTNLWEEYEMFRGTEPGDMETYSGVKTVTILSISFTAVPEEFLQVFPHMEVLVDREYCDGDTRPCFRYPGVTYYFEQKHCTRIVGNTDFFSWMEKFIGYDSVLTCVKELEFHHCEETRSRVRSHRVKVYTRERLTKLVSCVKSRLPNLETMILTNSSCSLEHSNASIQEIDAKGLEIPEGRSRFYWSLYDV